MLTAVLLRIILGFGPLSVGILLLALVISWIYKFFQLGRETRKRQARAIAIVCLIIIVTVGLSYLVGLWLMPNL